MKRVKRQWIVALFDWSRYKKIRYVIKRDRLRIKVYCPMDYVPFAGYPTIRGITRTAKRLVKLPMFFDYLFLNYSPYIYSYETIRKRLPMVTPVTVAKKIMTVSADEIARVKLIEQERCKLYQKMIQPDYACLHTDFMDKSVCIRDGTLTGIIGKVVGFIGKRKLVIEICMFNRLLKCQMDVDDVEVCT